MQKALRWESGAGLRSRVGDGRVPIKYREGLGAGHKLPSLSFRKLPPPFLLQEWTQGRPERWWWPGLREEGATDKNETQLRPEVTAFSWHSRSPLFSSITV